MKATDFSDPLSKINLEFFFLKKDSIMFFSYPLQIFLDSYKFVSHNNYISNLKIQRYKIKFHLKQYI